MPSTATYPGLTGAGLVSFSGTCGIDNQPGRFTMTLNRGVTVAPSGTLVFTDGTRTITVPGCSVADARWVDQGRYQITLEDRRWRWAKGGMVFGRYNVPLEDSEGVKWEKTPRELAELLWAEMQESDLDVLLLPNDARPEVNWWRSNPAEELIALLAQLGCCLAPQLTGAWKVYPLGYGAAYEPPAGFRMSYDVAQEFARYPDAISVVTGPIQYEACFALEAVGEDTDGSIKPIDELSYAPDEWGLQLEGFPGIPGTYDKDGKTLNLRDLAASCIFKWYRIATMPAGSGANSLNPPGYPTTLPPVESLSQLLPLRPYVNETYNTAGDPNFGDKKPAEVWGEYQKVEIVSFTTRPGTKVLDGFSLDAERGIVHFGQSMRRRQQITFEGQPTIVLSPATLYLRCAVEVTQPEINIPAGYQKTVATGASNGTGPLPVEVEELELQWRPVWKADGTLEALAEGTEYPNNRDEVDAKADYYLDAQLAALQGATGGTMQLAGIHAPNLNGLQTNVSWSFGANEAPTTEIGLASSANPYLPDYERLQKETLTKSQQLKRERQGRLAQRKLYRGPV